MLILSCIVFGLALWFGCYLLNRDWRNRALRRTGAGLCSYALALGADTLQAVAQPTAGMANWFAALLLLPALCWSGALIALLPAGRLKTRLDRLWLFGVIPLVVALALFDSRTFAVNTAPVWQLGYLLASLVALIALLDAHVALWPTMRAHTRARIFGLLLAATLFFTLGGALLIIPLGLLPRDWTVLAIGSDLALFGFAVVWLDAFEQGEALLPDVVLSFDAALLAALLFGGQVALVIAWSTGPTLLLSSLLLTVIASAIVVVVFASTAQRALDRLAFRRFPQLRRAREDLRTAAQVLPRIAPVQPLDALDDDSFTRLTRQTLSNFGNLPRLATSPLAQIPAIDRRLAQRGAPDDTLERAAELKALLAESIARLKPRTGQAFGTSDEWRYYNALYFPYVLGLKPYSRRSQHALHDPTAQAALDWFQRQIPERTLYNWQNAAASLVARDLREQLREP